MGVVRLVVLPIVLVQIVARMRGLAQVAAGLPARPLAALAAQFGPGARVDRGRVAQPLEVGRRVAAHDLGPVAQEEVDCFII